MNKERLTKELLENWTVPSGKTKAEAWEAIQARIDADQDKPMSKVVSMRRVAWTAVAAACVALAVFAIWPKEEWVEFAQIQKANEAIVLPDGSQVWLNADSKLRYEKSEWSSERSVYLTGEGYFEVQKGSKFSVSTSDGLVSVLGTSFNIYERSNELEVECYTGSVGVDYAEDNVVLSPGEATRVESKALKSPFNIKDTGPDWKEGYYRFQNEDAGHIFEELERQFGCTIEIPRDLEKRSTCEFDCLNLDQALTIVCLSMDLEFQIGKNLQVSIWEAKKESHP